MSGGSGHVERRSKGSWQVRVELGNDENGNRKRAIRMVKGTRRDADKVLAEMIHQHTTGYLIEPARETVSAFFTRWLRDYAAVKTAPACYLRYASIVRLHILPALGHLKLIDVRPAHLVEAEQKWLTSGRKGHGASRGLSPKTVIIHHLLLHLAFGHAVKWGLLGRNPVDAVDAPSAERKEMHALDLEQSRILLDALDGAPEGAALSTLLLSGLRAGELLGLRWSDVDLSTRHITVQQQLQRLAAGVYVARTTKTHRSVRSVSIPAELVDILRARKIEQNEQHLHVGSLWQSTDLVFTDELGRHLTNDRIRRALDKTLRNAGLPAIRLHDLRHTHASIGLEAGLSLKVLQQRLGHSSYVVTADYYSHITSGMHDAAADVLGDALRRRVV